MNDDTLRERERVNKKKNIKLYKKSTQNYGRYIVRINNLKLKPLFLKCK